MLVTEDFLGGDGIVQIISVDDGLALNFEDGEFTLLDQAVEGGGPYLEHLAYFLTGVYTAGFVFGCRLAGTGFVQHFADDRFEDAAECIHDGFRRTHGY